MDVKINTLLNVTCCFTCETRHFRQAEIFTSRSHHHSILNNHILGQDHYIFSQKNLTVPLDFEVPPLLAYLPKKTIKTQLRIFLTSF